MSERKEIEEEEEEEAACWDLGHSSVTVPEGRPETEPDRFRQHPDSATVLQLQRQMTAAHGGAARTMRKEGTLPNASRGRAQMVPGHERNEGFCQ